MYVGATHANAIDFVNLQYDDTELIDYVKTLHTSARAWHSQNIIKDGMMWRSIVSVLNNEAGSNGTDKAFLEENNDVEFLGFVNVYNKANADRTIQAFYIVAIALFRYDQTNKRRVIGCVIAAQEMRSSTIQERLIQMVHYSSSAEMIPALSSSTSQGTTESPLMHFTWGDFYFHRLRPMLQHLILVSPAGHLEEDNPNSL